MAFWLDPEDLEWLADQCLCGRNARLRLAQEVPRELLKESDVLKNVGGEAHDIRCPIHQVEGRHRALQGWAPKQA